MARHHFVLLAVALLALPLQGQAPRPLWEADLSRFGYQGRPPASVSKVAPGSENTFAWANQQGVAFLDSGVVAAYFVVDNTPHDSASGDLASFRLVAVFLNGKNGEPIKQLDWALPPDSGQLGQSFLFPAAHGKFLVILGNRVELYSSEFQPLARFEAPGEMRPIASPAGDSLLLQADSAHTLQYTLLDTTRLAVLKSWSEPAADPAFPVDSLWGERFAGAGSSALFVGSPSSPSKKLLAFRPGFCDTMKSTNQVLPGHACDAQENLPTVSGNSCGAWRFIGQDSLVGAVCSGDTRLLTVSTDGRITSEFNLGLEQPDGPVIASSNGLRFAVPSMRWGLGANNVPDKQTARVFDLHSQEPLFTVDVPPNPDSPHGFFFSNYGDTRFGWGGLSLSPDGSLLAVKSGASVRIYAVPNKPPSRECSFNCNDSSLRANPPAAPLRSTPPPISPLTERMLSWLPADTETVIGTTGPLPIPAAARDATGNSQAEVRDTFQRYFLLSLSRLGAGFGDARISASLEGSRTFRPPNGLGMASYQGAAIVVFTTGISAQAAAFLRDSSSNALRSEQIEGNTVEIFQDKVEQNILTTYVVFPKPDLAVVATDEGFLREVLSRINGKQGERALPDTLPEWKHVDTSAAFWAVRHYSKDQASRFPLLPSACRAGHAADEKPVGLTFSFTPRASSPATIDYLSGDKDYLHCIQEELFRKNEQGVAEMRMQYSEAQNGVMEGSYHLDEIESARYFLFVLEALLGHPIFV
ncbi:hypothetical protein DYQ86_13650 [Acidobacteria bacterium AB60]|nr:hypothetical protein DYQ86_13650 [Acidobacteria bacterium AB60]